jgi:hypothetical protein
MLLCALAAAAAEVDIPVPRIDVQAWRMPVDAERTAWADDTSLHDGFAGRLAVAYARDPLVWRDADGDTVSVVQDLLGINAIAAFSTWRVRLAADIPVYPLAGGELASSPGLGDIAVDGKLVALDAAEAALGLGADIRVRLPTSTSDLPLGTGGLGWEAALVADKPAGPVRVAGNVGIRGGPTATLANTTISNQVTWRAGLGWTVVEPAGISLDAAGAVAVGGGATGAGSPAEVLVGGWVELSEALALRAAVGRGVSEGIGAPVFRAIAAVSWAPDWRGTPTPRTQRTKVAVAPSPPSPPMPVDDIGIAGDPPPPAPPPLPPVPVLDQFGLVGLGPDRLVLARPVRFDGEQLRAESYQVLDDIAAILAAHPEVAALRIEAHTDASEDVTVNLPQSGMRAIAVLNYVVGRGVAAERILPAGYGSTRPLVAGNDEAARSKNDRVDFVITKWEAVP